MTRSKLIAIALIVAGTAAGIGFALMTREQQALPAAAAAAAATQPASAADDFEPTMPNVADASGPAPDGMAWIPGGEFSMGAADPLGKDANVVGMPCSPNMRAGVPASPPAPDSP